jgi:hypothetical protein
MPISLEDETQIRTYVERGIPDSEIQEFIEIVFKVAQKLNIKPLTINEKNLFTQIKNIMKNDTRIINTCHNSRLLKDKCDALIRMLKNNLHINGGRRKTMKRRKKMKRTKRMKKSRRWFSI